MDMISTLQLLVCYSSELFGLLLAAWLSTHLTLHGPPPPYVSTSQSPYLSPSHFFFVFHTLSSCGAPMVTCGRSKQDKLSTHKSPAVCVPTFLGSPCMATKTPPEAPTTSGSHHQPIQMSATSFEVADCYVNPRCFSPAQPLTHLKTRTLAKVVLCCWMIVSFIISSLLHPHRLSSQFWFVNMLLMGFGGWFQAMVTWGEQDMATIRSCQLQSWHIPQVWAVTVMTPSHCAFVWPVLQLLWIPTPIEWEGFPP